MNFNFLNAACSIAINDVIFGKPQQRAIKSTNSQNKRTQNREGEGIHKKNTTLLQTSLLKN